ncbi:organic cation transporter protein-like [Lingula anatina]|uniref:Organic cation transporter protein-like n=1 Tax=Lingula anatina TaxID=7574 RepID=A0A2R2MS20_LINAN|nr:organic cation transporter protein-like [Lingula anatina]|eukprot:XP_023932923.1 organic cation transporter protein-like [Lingula anatina]
MTSAMEFDDVLRHLGEFGRYQRRVYALLCLPAIFVALQVMSAVFFHQTPEHRCKIRSLSNDTYEVQGAWHEARIQHHIPVTSAGTYSDCKYYNYIVTHYDVYDDVTDHTVLRSNVTCNEWVYDKSIFDETVQTEFNLVCGREGKETVAQVAYLGGELAGGFLFGLLADYTGRKFAIITGVLLQGSFGLASALAPDVDSFTFFRFVVGAADSGTFASLFVLAMELVGPSKRMLVGIVIEYFFAAGYVLVTGLAYTLRHWRHLIATISAPSFVFVSYWWLIPESPRWLLASGKERQRNEAERILKHAAKINRAKLPEDIFENISVYEGQTASPVNILHSRRLFTTLFIVALNWFVVSMVYFGLSLNSGKIGGDVFVNFLIIGLVEFPAYSVCFVIDRLGRRPLHIAGMVVGGLALLCTIFVEVYAEKGTEAYKWSIVCLTLIAKFGSTVAFAIVFIWTAELFPTVLRNFVMGFCNTMGRVGGMTAPVIVNEIAADVVLGKSIPLVIFGAASVVAGIMALALPETANCPLPETIEEAENLRKKSPVAPLDTTTETPL